MNRPVVIVNPLSSGIELAPAFRARGIPAIAVTLDYGEWPEFGSRLRESDFIETIPAHAGLLDLLREKKPIAIIPGSEEGIPLADDLTAALTPKYANDPRKSIHRLHKSLMQQALKEVGVPTLLTLHTASENEAANWIDQNQLKNRALVIKPPSSSGSEMVFHIGENQDWKTVFRRVLTEVLLSGKKNEAVVVQEQAVGTEYAVGTVSIDGNHFLTHLMKYNKTSSGERKTVFDHVEFVAYDQENLGELFDYTKKALDALGVRWGASHTEVMLTQNGPRLIESSPRMIGGPVMEFTREATGSSQVDKLVEAYVDGNLSSEEYVLRKTVVPVFLKSPARGKISQIEVFDRSTELPTFFRKYLWYQNGDRVPKTVDYLTSIGIIALSGSRACIFKDYDELRKMELGIVIDESEGSDP